jgi:hypothetical protein
VDPRLFEQLFGVGMDGCDELIAARSARTSAVARAMRVEFSATFSRETLAFFSQAS